MHQGTPWQGCGVSAKTPSYPNLLRSYMLDVADYERIRRMVQIEGKTQRQVAEELGHSRWRDPQ